MPRADDPRTHPVHQLRLVVEAEDFDAALAFYRDALGLPEQAAFSGDGDARVVILDAGRATLELANPAQRRMIDTVEVGRVLDPAIRVALEVDDTEATVATLVAAGATALAPSVVTPWRSRNARLLDPEGLQLTVFQELEPLDQRATRPGFGTAATGPAGTDPGGATPDEADALAALLTETVSMATDNAAAGQLPFAALVVRDGVVIGRGTNTALADGDPTAHAEVAAVRDACRRLGTLDLTGATVVASCEPCGMCHVACATAGIRRLVYAAPKESVPDLGDGIDRTVPRAMQTALRDLRPEDLRHVPTPDAEAPFDRFLANRDR